MANLDEAAPERDVWMDRLIDGRYRVLRWLSADETHTLVECVQANLGRVVLLRMLAKGLWETRTDPTPFLTEARRHAEVKHPRLATILDGCTAQDDGSHYVVLGPPAGRPLSDYPREAISVAALRELAAGLLRGLAALHEAGIVHGDVRPQTIWVALDGEGVATVTLLDGLARPTGTSVDRAPEGPVDGRSDLFGLGRAVFDRVVGSPTPVHALLSFAVHCCMDDPDRRFANAAVALEALHAMSLDGAAPETTVVVQAVGIQAEKVAHSAAIPTVGTTHVDVAEGAHARQIVVAATSSLGKAFRSFALYPENNPLLPQLAEEVCKHFDIFFMQYDRLDLWVDRFALRYKQSSVFEDADVRGSYPFRLYMDGIRKLSFSAGLTREELFDYIVCLQRAAEPGNPTIDLVTVMWERRFPHIFCRMVEDLVPPPKEELNGVLGAKKRGHAWNGIEVVDRLPPVPDFSAWRPRAVESLLGRDDVAVISALTRDQADENAVWHYMLHLLAAMKLCIGTPDADELRMSLSEALRALDGQREYKQILQIVLAIRELLTRIESEDFRLALEHVLERVSGEREVQRMIERLCTPASSPVSGPQEEPKRIAQLLAELNPEVIPLIIERLDQIPTEHLPSIQLVLLVQCKSRPWHLAAAVRHERAAVARVAIRVLREIEGPRASGELLVALGHESADVRIDALKTLQPRGDERLMERLPALLRDTSTAVRQLGLGLCSDLTASALVNTLGPLLAEPGFSSRPGDELAALFRLLTTVGGGEAVVALAPLVTDPPRGRLADRLRTIMRRAFGPDEDGALFPLAIRALLLIDTEAARSALDVAQSSRLRQRRKLVQRARAAHSRRVT